VPAKAGMTAKKDGGEGYRALMRFRLDETLKKTAAHLQRRASAASPASC